MIKEEQIREELLASLHQISAKMPKSASTTTCSPRPGVTSNSPSAR